MCKKTIITFLVIMSWSNTIWAETTETTEVPYQQNLIPIAVAGSGLSLLVSGVVLLPWGHMSSETVRVPSPEGTRLVTTTFDSETLIRPIILSSLGLVLTVFAIIAWQYRHRHRRTPGDQDDRRQRLLHYD